MKLYAQASMEINRQHDQFYMWLAREQFGWTPRGTITVCNRDRLGKSMHLPPNWECVYLPLRSE